MSAGTVKLARLPSMVLASTRRVSSANSMTMVTLSAAKSLGIGSPVVSAAAQRFTANWAQHPATTGRIALVGAGGKVARKLRPLVIVGVSFALASVGRLFDLH
jgi:hypothetical protein